jgi:Rieske Fe-S protein
MADPKRSPVDRRTLLRGLAGVVAAGWLVACGGDDDDPEAADPTTSADDTGGDTGGGSGGGGEDGGNGGNGGNGGGDGGGDSGGSDSGGGDVLTAASAVAVGGGVIVDETYVVTQPAAGEFKAFTAICTHQGCVLAEVVDNQINCNSSCGHGSVFSAEDGSVVNGPAAAPLEEETITVQGDDVLLG